MKSELIHQEHHLFPTIFQGDLYDIDWIRIYVGHCHWRGSDSLMVNFVYLI